MEITGLDGPMTIARAVAMASSTSGVGAAARAWRKSTSWIGPSPPRRMRNSWSENQLPSAMTRVRTGLSDIGSTRARTSSAAPMRAWASVRRAPSSSARARSMAMARSRSPRLNHTSTPSSRSPSMTEKVSSLSPQPRSSIRSASQKVTRSGSGETWPP